MDYDQLLQENGRLNKEFYYTTVQLSEAKKDIEKQKDQIDSLESDNKHLIEEAKLIKQRFCSDCANKELIALKQRLKELERMFIDCKDLHQALVSKWNDAQAKLIVKEKENSILRDECIALWQQMAAKTTYTEEELKEFK